MADHRPRLRRLIAPNPLSTIAAPASSSHRTTPPDGDGVDGPVEASAILAEGETAGASASIAGDGDAVDVVMAGGVALAAPPAEGVARGDGVAVVRGGAAGQTWLNDTEGGCIPLPVE